jgi:hypothetical protein
MGQPARCDGHAYFNVSASYYPSSIRRGHAADRQQIDPRFCQKGAAFND